MGVHVANEVLRNHLNAQSTTDIEVSSVATPFDLREFTDPKIVEYFLPGNLYYYKSCLPDRYPMPLHTDTVRALTTRCVDPENVTVFKVC